MINNDTTVFCENFSAKKYEKMHRFFSQSLHIKSIISLILTFHQNGKTYKNLKKLVYFFVICELFFSFEELYCDFHTFLVRSARLERDRDVANDIFFFIFATRPIFPSFGICTELIL